MHTATVIRQSCDRPNIAIEVKPKKGDGKKRPSHSDGNGHAQKSMWHYLLSSCGYNFGYSISVTKERS